MDCSRLKQHTAAEPSMSEPSKGSAKRKPEAANDVSQLAGASQALKKPNTASDASQLAGDIRDFKKRCYWDLIDYPARKAKTAASQSSSASQPTDLKVRILFVDAGCIAESLQACLIPDHRPELSADDILGAAEELEASIIIGSDFPIDEAPAADCKMWDSCKSTMQHTRSHGDYASTSWHCWWNYDAWTVTSFSSIPLSTSPQDLQHRECAMMQLCHRSGYELAVMYFKNLRGRQSAAADTLQLDVGQRQQVLETAFSFLFEPRNGDALVAGDFGIGLPTVHAHMRAKGVQHLVQSHCIQRQTFHTLFVSGMNINPLHSCTTINAESQRMLVHEIKRSSGDGHPTTESQAVQEEEIKRSSGDEHPTTAPQLLQEEDKLISRRQVQMKMLQQLTDGANQNFPDSDDARLTVELLYQPVIEQFPDEKGVWHTKPTNVDISGNTFVCAILLLKKLRTQEGTEENPVVDNQTLTEDQFESAWKKLRDIFETYFVLNTSLALRCSQMKTNPSSLTGKAKDAIRHNTRGALRVWLRTLLGDKAFVVALLKHGCFDFADMRQCAIALRKEAADEPGGIPQSAGADPVKKAAAKQARKLQKDAAKWKEWQQEGRKMSAYQQQNIILLDTGELSLRAKIAREACGFGKGVEKSLTRDQAMLMEAFTNKHLENYFRAV